MRHPPRSACLRLCALSTVALLAACSAEEQTQFVAGLTTQMQVPKELSSVGIVVQSGGKLVFCDNYPVADGTASLPSTLGLRPSGDPATPVTMTVLGFETAQPNFATDCVVSRPEVGQDGVRVIRRRRSPYVPNRVLYLPMPIKHVCSDVGCSEGQTCIGGECKPLDIDPSTLPEYHDQIVFGDTNTCFGATLCLPGGMTIPARLVDAAQCKFRLDLPDGLPAPVGLNVRILHENFTPEVLDLDPEEGFTVPDPSKPLEFQLAPSLCTSRYKTGKILAVWASSVCLSKTPYQPICSGDLGQILAGTYGSASGEATCVAGARLRPTESALYVLMDRSASMGAFFGDAGLQQVLSLSLQDPVFERTNVGFKFLPATNAACGATEAAPNSYASLTAPGDVPFTLALDAQSAIAAKIGDTSNVSASDAPLFLDAVLSPGGAYAALRKLTPTAPSTAFNRRALLILGNRGLWTRCSGGVSPDQLAATALANGMHTYAVALAAPGTANQEGREPLADASAIATAGGTTVFDATTDPNAGALALATITADLGSCVYDKPADVDLNAGRANLTLSYFDPIYQVQTVIHHDAACLSSSTTGTGWNVDKEERVRVCGAPCSRLRDVLMASATLAAKASLPAPLLPIHVNVPCAK